MARQNYNAFLRAAKRELGLSHTQARAMYRGVTERLGRPAKGVDVGRHPRIAKQEAAKASGRPLAAPAPAPAPARRGGRGGGPGGPGGGGGGPTGGGGGQVIPPDRFNEIDAEWLDFDQDFGDDEEEYG